MPSTNKTSFLRLHRWLGQDKPKKDDFVEDNLAVDAACQSLQSQITQTNTQLDSRVNNLNTTLTASINSAKSKADTHSANTTVHITASERTLWNKFGIVVGSYTGTGANNRSVSLGSTPKFGVVFPVGTAPTTCLWGNMAYFIWWGFFSSLGSTGGITLSGSSLTLKSSETTDPNGAGYRLNNNSTTYVYAFFKV